MNHLHWPRALLHSDDAAADLQRALEIQEARPAAEPWHARTWLALGDAQAKDNNYDEARRVWREGLTRFPHSEVLHGRLTLADNGALLDHIEEVRGIDRPIDTDLSFISE